MSSWTVRGDHPCRPMNCLLVMKIKWSLDINTGAVERSEAARARRLAGATVVGLRATSYGAHDPLASIHGPYISAIDGPGGPIITADHLTRDSTIASM